MPSNPFANDTIPESWYILEETHVDKATLEKYAAYAPDSSMYLKPALWAVLRKVPKNLDPQLAELKKLPKSGDYLWFQSIIDKILFNLENAAFNALKPSQITSWDEMKEVYLNIITQAKNELPFIGCKWLFLRDLFTRIREGPQMLDDRSMDPKMFGWIDLITKAELGHKIMLMTQIIQVDFIMPAYESRKYQQLIREFFITFTTDLDVEPPLISEELFPHLKEYKKELKKFIIAIQNEINTPQYKAMGSRALSSLCITRKKLFKLMGEPIRTIMDTYMSPLESFISALEHDGILKNKGQKYSIDIEMWEKVQTFVSPKKSDSTTKEKGKRVKNFKPN